MTAQPQTRLTKAFIHPGFPSSRFAPVWANSRQIRSCLSQPKVAKLGIEVVVHDDLPSAAKQRCKPLAHPSSPHSCSSGRGEQRAATCCEESSPEISRGQNFRKATYISHLPHHHQNCTFGRIPPTRYNASRHSSPGCLAAFCLAYCSPTRAVAQRGKHFVQSIAEKAQPSSTFRDLESKDSRSCSYKTCWCLM